MRDYVERRSTGLFVADTRVALESVVYEYKGGASAESILLSYPGLSSLENVYGAITYYLANEGAVERYLEATDKLWDGMRSKAKSSEPLQQRLSLAKKEATIRRE